MKKIKVVIPGTFDPITNGHLDLISRVKKIFKFITVAIYSEPKKKNLFNSKERFKMIAKVLKGISNNIEIKIFKGLLVDFMKLNKISIVVRGIRDSSDFKNERYLEKINKFISSKKIETIFIFSNSEFDFLSSTFVKKLFFLKGNINKFVHPYVKKKFLNLNFINKKF